MQKRTAPPEQTSIADADLQAFEEVGQGLAGSKLDLILHSPGGPPEAAGAIVRFLRSRFHDIRIIVPNLAISAATTMVCGADQVVLGKHSFLGPTDPQLLLPTGSGLRLVAAQAVLDQFDRAQRECLDPVNLPGWLPILMQCGPDLLVRCETALELTRDLVTSWLETHMLKAREDRTERARQIASRLADQTYFKSHARHIARSEIEELGLSVKRLEADATLQDLALSVFRATTRTFAGSDAVKIVENHFGHALIESSPPAALTPRSTGAPPPEVSARCPAARAA